MIPVQRGPLMKKPLRGALLVAIVAATASRVPLTAAVPVQPANDNTPFYHPTGRMDLTASMVRALQASSCEALRSIALPRVTITSVELVAAGTASRGRGDAG